MKKDLISNKLTLIIMTALIAVHYYIFKDFFLNQQGHLGHDYGYFFPLLLDGYYWFVSNDLLTPYWFTPSFCGGVPRFANPQGIYYSLPQFLTFVFNPLTSLKVTFVAFGGLGFVGFFLLLRRIFLTQRPTALLGAALFLFNGFYVYRFIVGHLTFHSFMLVPLIAFCVLRHNQTKSSFDLAGYVFDVALSALMFAYMVYSGMVNGIIPAIMSVVIIIFIYRFFLGPDDNLKRGLVKLALGGVLALLIAAPKLNAMTCFLGHFIRDMYPLPGFERIGDILTVVFYSLFLDNAEDVADNFLVNNRWRLFEHEYEFGVTLVPLVIIVLGIVLCLKKIYRSRFWLDAGFYKIVCVSVVFVILVLPIVLNIYHPGWNGILKQIPFIKTSSNLIRWFAVYIPVIILVMAIVIERADILRKNAVFVVAVGLVLLVYFNYTSDKKFYHDQHYNPDEILKAYDIVKSKQAVPAINFIYAYLDSSGDPMQPIYRNNSLAEGRSQLLCYEPVFGYRLELLPFKSLKQGPTMFNDGGVLNIKNPSCYVFSKENGCELGDHFTIHQREEALAFISFSEFDFKISKRQQTANYVGIVSLLGAALAVLLYLVLWLRGSMIPIDSDKV